SAQALEPVPCLGRRARAGLARGARGVRLRLRERASGHGEPRRSRRPRGHCRSLLSVCLARAGALEAKPANSRAFHHHGVSMDSLHAIGFYVSSGVLILGGLGVALLPGRDLRGVALAVTGAGLAGAYVSLSAGF